MSKMQSILMLMFVTLLAAPASAVSVQYYLGVDDYGDLWIDGVLVAHYDGGAQGHDFTDVLDLSPGWHDVELHIKNRWGSSTVGLYEVTGPGPDLTHVPREDLRSLNEQGQYVSGLRAEYYTLGGSTPYKTVYGEGPIAHTSGGDTGYRLGYYQGEYGDGTGAPWVGLWQTFEERLYGQIYVGDPSTVAVQYNLGVDDYGDLYIDGVLEAHYDASPQGGDMTDVLHLTPGWHDIEILIKNRWGSSSVGLYTVPGPGQLEFVPREDLRCLNEQGQYVSGLKAEYYEPGGTTPYKIIYGEGPIHHVSGGDTGYRLGVYQDEYGDGSGPPWVGLWQKFEERLTGQILVGDVPSNTPPVAVCQDVTVEAGDGCVADADVDNGSYDPDGDDISVTVTPEGPYPLGDTVVTLTVTDSHGESDSCTATVTVQDTQPPVIVLAVVTPQLAAVGETVSFDAAVGDECALTTVWNFGDDQTSEDTVATHAYDTPGIYAATFTVTDSSSNSSADEFFVVVYDASAGFVTGGGWIESPVNENYQYMQVGGKANFGFVSKYKKGTTIPTGQTEFMFKAGDLNFHSSSYEWLVVTGSDYAMFKGTGTINDSGEYKFMIWAGDSPADTFRIRLWTEDESGVETDVYDNGVDQDISGGSIIIHSK
ncbi:MAG: PKD domain-containing protein [Planctomycetota bacterium]|jgi:hypothetical protein